MVELCGAFHINFEDQSFAMASARPVTIESTYWRNVQLLASEIEEAIVIFHTAEEINGLALRDPAIYRVLNEEPLFWQAYRSTCQTALFMALGRIFDSSSDGHSIHTVISATVDNIQFFSRSALKSEEDNRRPRARVARYVCSSGLGAGNCRGFEVSEACSATAQQAL
jgi:hypothetical protein